MLWPPCWRNCSRESAELIVGAHRRHAGRSDAAAVHSAFRASNALLIISGPRRSLGEFPLRLEISPMRTEPLGAE